RDPDFWSSAHYGLVYAGKHPRPPACARGRRRSPPERGLPRPQSPPLNRPLSLHDPDHRGRHPLEVAPQRLAWTREPPARRRRALVRAPLAWLGKDYIMWSLVLTSVWQFLPFVVIAYLARLQTIPPERYEAAKVDGASAWQRIAFVTLPQTWNVLFVIALLR